MVWNQFGDFIDLDPDPHSLNFVDPDPHTIDADPHHWENGYELGVLETLIPNLNTHW